MKIQILSTLFVTAALLCGCSSPKFTEYHGSEVFQGAGGTMRTVDGIDFWENGEPDRKYKILGVIEESHKSRLPFGRFSRLFSNTGDRDSAIAKFAHKQGGDAVIFAGETPEPSTDSEQSSEGWSGHGNHRRLAKPVVIKYVE
jgi:hypothetical protein